MNDRRKLVMALGAGVLAAPFSSFAQQQKVYRIGVLYSLGLRTPGIQGFMQEIQRLGYVDGQSASIVTRLAEGNVALMPAFAAELVAEKVDVIFANDTNAVRAAKQATAAIPIVFSFVSDPVGSGFVESLGHPGGNITGITNISRELAAKRLQVLKEIIPKASRVAVLVTDEPQVEPQLEQVQQAAKRLGISVMTTQVMSRSDFDDAGKLLRSWRADSIYVPISTKNAANAKLLVEFAAQLRLPAIYSSLTFADAGGLVSYGARSEALSRRAAQYVDMILKGAKPANLPVEQPTSFEMVLNMKVANALGLKIPESILLQATKVIE